MPKQGEPPTRVLPLPLLGKEIQPLLRFRKEKEISPSAESDKGSDPWPRKLLEKRSAVPTPQIVYCNTKLETIAPDGIDILHSKTKTFPL